MAPFALTKGLMLKTMPNRSDKGLTLEMSAFFYPLRCLIYVFNLVVNTKLPANAQNVWLSFKTLYDGQFTSSTQLIILNYPGVW